MAQERYIEGVPCWVDTARRDPAAIAEFYAGLFGWELQDVMPEGSQGTYLTAFVDGGQVAAIGSLPPGVTENEGWMTYVWAASADDAVAKARDAGGKVLLEPMDVFDAGRMAAFADPDGAEVRVWQPGTHRGATVVNQHGSVNFNDLHARDLDGVKGFYRDVFGWGTLDLGGPGAMWTLDGYADHLEELNPGMKARMEEAGAPPGFLDVVATAQPAQGGEPPHWGVTFAVDDADEAARRAPELGGRVLAEPFDAPWVRMTVLADPDGVPFVASRYAPENKDLQG